MLFNYDFRQVINVQICLVANAAWHANATYPSKEEVYVWAGGRRKSGWQSFWRGNHKFMQRIAGLGANLCAITWAFCGCTYEICMQFWICHSFKCFLDYILGSSRRSSYNTATTTAKGAQIIPGNVIIVFVCLPLLSPTLPSSLFLCAYVRLSLPRRLRLNEPQCLGACNTEHSAPHSKAKQNRQCHLPQGSTEMILA